MAREVREIWHFSKDDEDPKSFWVLEGIQQVE
jgi:predicted lipid-binding transport protein (Tim44 family)